jgi:hypothetical protein
MANYCTLAELKGAMPDTAWGASYDTLMNALITRASRLIDRAAGRANDAFYASTATARTFDGSGCREQWVDEMAAAPTLVEVSETGSLTTYETWASTDYMLWPYNAAAEGRPYMRLDVDQLNGNKAVWYKFPKSVKITAKWGYSIAPPDEIKQACIIQSVRWFKRSQQAFQDAGAIVELGQLRYVQRLDPDVQTIIEHYGRTAI